MKNFRVPIFLCVLSLILICISACAEATSGQDAVSTAITQTQDVEATIEMGISRTMTAQAPTRTPTPSITPTFTPTFIPTSTSTKKPPTKTSTPTVTMTLPPFDTSECVDLKAHPDNWALWHTKMTGEEREAKTYPYFDSYDGKCVKFFAGGGINPVVADLIHSTVGFDLVIDEFTPSDVTDATEIKSFLGKDYRIVSLYSTVWGIWTVVESGEYEVLLRKIESFPIDQQPIVDDGIYNVSSGGTVIPGLWKSIRPSNDCYWARIDPSTGNIKQNHFGVGGISTRLQDGDTFESENCAPWVFVQP